MYRLVLSILYIAAFIKWGGGKKIFEEYYSTILFVILGDLAYNFIYYNYTLWRYESFINHTVSDLLVAFTIFPCAVILFLKYFPKGFIKGTGYILIWSTGNTILEFMSVSLGYFSYSNGWNLFWSFLVFIGAFSLVKLHYHHKFYTWIAAGILSLLTALIFRLPIMELK